MDVIQAYNAAMDSALAVTTRESTESPQYTFRPMALNPTQLYTVWFDVNPAVYFVPGSDLMPTGLAVMLPTPQSSEVVHIDHQ